MKKMFCILLALTMLLAGCRSAGGGTTVPSTEPSPKPSTDTTPASTGGTEPRETTFPSLPESTFGIDPILGELEGELLPFENAGKVRLNYEGNRSYVRYVTSVEDLPPEGSWTGYDEEYFETKALLIVVETLNSGTIQVELESIIVDGDTAYVNVSRTMDGDVGTSDMATWMLWAEVEKGLEYDWTLLNASRLPAGELY